jgi:hypothetical protein
MTAAAQLERIAAVSPPKGDVAIVLLDRGCGVWMWLCPDCLVRRIEQGWLKKELREPPYELQCQDCPRTDGEG